MTRLIPTHKNLPVGSILMRHSQVHFVRLLHTYLQRSNRLCLLLTLTHKLHLRHRVKVMYDFHDDAK